MVEEVKKVCATYARISPRDKKQIESSLSLEDQERICMDFIKQRGWLHFKHYVDDRKSGGKRKTRKAYLRMLEDTKSGLFNAIIFWRIDRFTRDNADFWMDYKHLESLNVEIISTQENINMQTASGRLSIGMQVQIAEYQRLQKRDEAINRLSFYKEKKMFVRRIPFGYDYNHKTKHLSINPEKAKVIKQIYDLAIQEKKLYEIRNSICEYENKYSKQWILHVLKNPAYTGYCHVRNLIWKCDFIPIIDKETFFKRNPKYKDIIPEESVIT